MSETTSVARLDADEERVLRTLDERVSLDEAQVGAQAELAPSKVRAALVRLAATGYARAFSTRDVQRYLRIRNM